jgi:hypothetical protein
MREVEGTEMPGGPGRWLLAYAVTPYASSNAALA